jgi:inosine/xanthosine triphosphate pyrophosphatase family protein
MEIKRNRVIQTLKRLPGPYQKILQAVEEQAGAIKFKQELLKRVIKACVFVVCIAYSV